MSTSWHEGKAVSGRHDGGSKKLGAHIFTFENKAEKENCMLVEIINTQGCNFCSNVPPPQRFYNFLKHQHHERESE